MIRLASNKDLAAIENIYDRIHAMEQAGHYTTGWLKGIYPTAQTAQAAIDAGTMYVYEDAGVILAAGKIDQDQPDSYAQISWSMELSGNQVLVFHTLVVHPDHSGQGIAQRFIAFYEETARNIGCKSLRIDTNARNLRARKLYQHLGYSERGIVPCQFNGIEGVQLVCLEKLL